MSCDGTCSQPYCEERDGPRAAREPLTKHDTKLTNPKDLVGSNKLPLHLWPTTATVMGSLALLDGMLKYGRSNWREAGVRSSIYVDAAVRHLLAFWEGEEEDPDSGIPHLSHALACIAIIVDARAAGKLNDDRAYNGSGYRKLVEELTPHVNRLKELHADKDPRHFTIADNPESDGGTCTETGGCDSCLDKDYCKGLRVEVGLEKPAFGVETDPVGARYRRTGERRPPKSGEHYISESHVSLGRVLKATISAGYNERTIVELV